MILCNKVTKFLFMKKLILACCIISAMGFNFAEYTIKLPLEKDGGGNLPTGSIIMSPMNEIENWISSDPYFTSWTNVNGPYDCSNWAPDPSGITIGIEYTQTATDCSQLQTRSRQEREQEINTLAYRDVGTPIDENQTVSATDTRLAIGSMENWINIAPSYTSWINDGVLYGCSNWSPQTSSYDIGVQFTQTATNCSQNQTRNRQDREQETTTLAIRNSGIAIVENQTQTNQTNTRLATGTRGPEECFYQWIHSSWVIDNGLSTAFFNGNLMVQNMAASSFNSGGYNYYAGAFVMGSMMGQTATANNYYICRRQL